MKLSEIYFGAIDVIRERGWCQGEFKSNDGGVCMIGAMHVFNKYYPFDAIYYFKNTVFPSLHPADANDKHCKTADDACAFLEIAACCAAAEGK